MSLNGTKDGFRIGMTRAGCVGAILCLLIATAGCAGIRGSARLDREVIRGDDLVLPMPVTTHVAEDTNCSVSPDGRRIVFVSNRSGNRDIWLQDLDIASMEPARQLTDHPGPDTFPRFSPDGRRIAFLSGREDAHNDIWLIEPESGNLTRVTNRSSWDSDPCWTPDGKAIIYAAAPDEFYPANLWMIGIKTDSRPEQLTSKGGFSPAVSPDGLCVAFISQREAQAGGQVWLLNLRERREVALTSPETACAQPAWSADGKFIYFARYADDTDRDGAVTVRDNACISRILFSQDLFSGASPGSSEQITSSRFYSLFPALTGQGLFYTSKRGESFDIWWLPETGELPDCANLTERIGAAAGAYARVPRDPFATVMACRAVVHEAQNSKGLTPKARAGVASALYAQGLVFQESGNRVQARAAFEDIGSSPLTAEAKVFGDLAELQLARMAGEDAMKTPETVKRTSGIKAVRERYEALISKNVSAAGTDIEGGLSVIEPAPTVEMVSASAALELGRLLEDIGEMQEALAVLDGVARDYPGQRGACAHALLSKADIYKILNDSEGLTAVYVKVLKEFPEQGAAAERAASGILNMKVGDSADSKASMDEKLVRLQGVLDNDEYRSIPVLNAAVLNRRGDLYYSVGEIPKARREYQMVVESADRDPEQVARAQLALAQIAYDQQDYERTLVIYNEITDEHKARGDALYKKARRAYIQRALEKANRDRDLGDAKLARKTFERLLELDPEIVEAHRGIIDCDATLDKTGADSGTGRGWLEQLKEGYEKLRVEKPGNSIPYFCLARIISYEGPDSWIGKPGETARRAELDIEAARFASAAIVRDAQIPYYHQLLGFLHERMGMALDDRSHYEMALESYITALTLSDREADPRNYADLMFNVGEIFKRMSDLPKAYQNYMKAMAAGLRLEKASRAAVVYDHSADAAIEVEDYAVARDMLERLLVTLDKVHGADAPAARREGQVRRAAVLDRLGLVCQQKGEHKDAITYLQQYCEVLNELIASSEERDAKLQYQRNWARARRNLAISFFHLGSGAKGTNPEMLAQALALFDECAKNAENLGVGDVSGGKSGSMMSYKVTQGLSTDASMAAQGFDEKGELRLLHTYMARIYELSGDVEPALLHLRRKLELYEIPKKPGMPRNAALVETAVVWSQVGEYHRRLGQHKEAAQSFENALNADAEGLNLHGRVVNAGNLGSLAVDLLQSGEGPAAFGGEAEFNAWLGAAFDSIEKALSDAVNDPLYAHPEYKVILNDALTLLAGRTGKVLPPMEALKTKPEAAQGAAPGAAQGAAQETAPATAPEQGKQKG
ncbi:MAG TPA: hypothetical protein PL033_10185 [Candidatus Brocadiia bacterium]|nr:hypothetical protein [Candidatus Brocadiia bacterium]